MFLTLFRDSEFRRMVLAAVVCLLGAPLFAAAENLPDMRPALIGSHKDALINLIETQKLIRNGQGDAALLFHCTIGPDGYPYLYRAYRVTPGGEKLKYEVLRCLQRTYFLPAVYNHRKVTSAFYGSVMFRVVNSEPRLRIFANQEMSELEKEADFIAPQSIEIPQHHYEYPPYPETPWASEDKPGIVEMSLSVDALGHLKDVQVIKETPPGYNFGAVALTVIKQNTYLPAFRNGRPVDSTTHIHFRFAPTGWRWR